MRRSTVCVIHILTSLTGYVVPSDLVTFSTITPLLPLESNTSTGHGILDDFTKEPQTTIFNLETDICNGTGVCSSSQSTIAYITSMPEYKAYIYLTRYFVFITSFPGFVTNPLTVVLSFTIKPHGTSEIYMFVLGLADFSVVCLRLTIRTLENVGYSWTEISCKILLYLTNLSYLFSNWIVVGWTAERFDAVVFPMKMNVWCTVRNVKTILVLFCIGSALVMIPEMTEINLKLNATKVKYYCWYTEFYFTSYFIVFTTIYMYIPILVVSVGNLTIIYKVKQASNKRATITTNMEIMHRRAREQRQMTLTLILVSTFFVCLHVPQIVAKVWQAINPDDDILYKKSVSEYLLFNVFISLGYQITDFQNSINFFLYCAFGTKVQRALRKMLKCIEKKES